MSTTPNGFARGAFLFLAVRAAHQHNLTWAKDARGLDRRSARDYLYGLLKELADGYHEGGIQDDDHLANIQTLADSMTVNHAKVLDRGRYRIGTAQKTLNLYLKYLWCAGWISEPPHCPFDNQVVSKLPDVPNKWRTWTTVDDTNAYQHWVSEARQVAGDISLAVWELGIWRPS